MGIVSRLLGLARGPKRRRAAPAVEKSGTGVPVLPAYPRTPGPGQRLREIEARREDRDLRSAEADSMAVYLAATLSSGAQAGGSCSGESSDSGSCSGGGGGGD